MFPGEDPRPVEVVGLVKKAVEELHLIITLAALFPLDNLQKALNVQRGFVNKRVRLILIAVETQAAERRAI
jgi:hypothetical protein